jgi:type IV secretory pathway protease TraF
MTGLSLGLSCTTARRRLSLGLYNARRSLSLGLYDARRLSLGVYDGWEAVAWLVFVDARIDVFVDARIDVMILSPSREGRLISQL